MALLRSFLANSRCRLSDSTKLFWAFSYSTEGSATAIPSPPQPPDSTTRDYLYNRISALGNPSTPISPILDQWLEEGRHRKHPELSGTITTLRAFSRFKQALEVSEWMSKHFKLSPRDAAVQLDLISKVRKVKEAEEYFNGLPSNLKESKVYGSLLNCYVRAKSTEKAEATMQEMKELGYFTTKLAYNVMLKLYSETREYEKLDALFQEMEAKGIVGDKHTLSHQLRAYVAKSDLDGMEKILVKARADPVISADWNIYAAVFNGYLEVGLKDKALEMLRNSEKVIEVKSRRYAYEVLMTLYAKVEDKDEVHRLWGLCKNSCKVHNKTFISVLSSLYKLEDIEGMEKIYHEWDAKKLGFDVRIPNLLIGAYCKKGLMEKAESVVKWLVESGIKPTGRTWDHMATGYYKCGHVEKAVEALKKATLASHPDWKPSFATLVGCTEYMKEKGDEDFTKFKSLLDKYSRPSSDISDALGVCKENVHPSA